jgi:hypothetical protein
MSESELSRKLKEDVTRTIPVWGAESVTLAGQLGMKATSTLLAHIETGGDTALLALEALRFADKASYDAIPVHKRAQIYGDALQKNLFYNTWGVPGHQLTYTADAFVALGEESIVILEPLLSEKKIAPLEGSEDATTAVIYGNRICDYAWVFIMQIKNRKYTYYQDPAERDKAITILQQELQKD